LGAEGTEERGMKGGKKTKEKELKKWGKHENGKNEKEGEGKDGDMLD